MELVNSRPPALEPMGSPSPDVGSQAGRAVILVVERDPHVRELEAYFLNEAGFAVEFADDGAAALSSAVRLRPSIVITGILVPKVDGLALCRAIKADARLRETMVLVFSILAAKTRALEAGADAFLLKPLAERRLVETVRDLLSHRRSRPAEEEHTT